MYVTLVVPIESYSLTPLVREVIQEIIGRWGGCTVVNGDGHWLDDKGVLYSEGVATLGVDCGEANYPTIQMWFDEVADHIRIAGEQQAVYYRVEVCRSRMVTATTVIGRTAYPSGRVPTMLANNEVADVVPF